jgi:tetratricopeptide (TPR) repeat protein
LKASYLLNLSLPFAFFMARGAEAWASRNAWLGALPGLGVGSVAIAVALVFTSGLVFHRYVDSEQMASVAAQFGKFGPTQQTYPLDGRNRHALEARAAVALFDDRPDAARLLYFRAAAMPLRNKSQRDYFENRIGVAAALDGAADRARMRFDNALSGKPDLQEALVSRGALSAHQGDLVAAAADLRAALDIDPSLPPAWTNLAVVLAMQGNDPEAAIARERAAAAEAEPPRGFPYGVGNGYLHGNGAGQRFMLVLSDDAGSLALYHPARSRLSRR